MYNNTIIAQLIKIGGGCLAFEWIWQYSKENDTLLWQVKLGGRPHMKVLFHSTNVESNNVYVQQSTATLEQHFCVK